MTREEVKEQLAKNPLEWDCTEPTKEGGIEMVRHCAYIVEPTIDSDIFYEIQASLEDGDATAKTTLLLSTMDVTQYTRAPYSIDLYVSDKSVHELKAKAEEHRLDLACRMLGVTE